MREARRSAGLTMADVAQGAMERGMAEITEQTIKNLESGRRASMAITDFLVLADVLQTPAVSLLFPLGTAATTELLPGRTVSTWDALAWFTGETPIAQPPPEGSPREVLDTFRTHGDLVAAALSSSALARERRRAATTTSDPLRRTALLERAAAYEQHAVEDRRELRTYRDRMRDRALAPPALSEELTPVDQAEPQELQEVNE